MDKVAVLCTILAVIAAADSATCYNGCTVMTKYEVTMSGETQDMRGMMPKECTGTAAACASGTECMVFKPIITADMTVASLSGKVKMEANTQMCLSSDMIDDVCSQITDGVQSMLSAAEGIISNVKADCGKPASGASGKPGGFISDVKVRGGKLEAASDASGFSFGALLVAVLYLVY